MAERLDITIANPKNEMRLISDQKKNNLVSVNFALIH